MRERIGGIAELVDENRRRRLLGDAPRLVLIIIGMALADVGARQHHLRAHRAQVRNLLAAHLVGNDQDELVALGDGDQREPESGVAGRRFDDDAAGLQLALRARRPPPWPAPGDP